LTGRSEKTPAAVAGVPSRSARLAGEIVRDEFPVHQVPESCNLIKGTEFESMINGKTSFFGSNSSGLGNRFSSYSDVPAAGTAINRYEPTGRSN
jgi:hypothetical protein